MNSKSQRGQRGFTLIELLVVLAILAMLAGVVGPKVMIALSSSKSKTALVQINDLGGALWRAPGAAGKSAAPWICRGVPGCFHRLRHQGELGRRLPRVEPRATDPTRYRCGEDESPNVRCSHIVGQLNHTYARHAHPGYRRGYVLHSLHQR